MRLIKRVYSFIKNRLWAFNEKIWCRYLQHQNQNEDVTIICNNCIAGVIYHNLGLQFKSPTINLSIQGIDYLLFVKCFEYYLSCDVIEEKDNPYHYPLGRLLSKDGKHPDILIHFIHYPSFEVAHAKWVERCSRVNLNNIYYIWEFFDECNDEALVHQFDQLPCKKITLLHRKGIILNHAAVLNLKTHSGTRAMSISPKGILGKRYLDQFDYVSFINH